MKKIVVLLLLVAGIVWFNRVGFNHAPANTNPVQYADTAKASAFIANDEAKILEAYQQQINDIPVEGYGQVVKILADDQTGSRHQKFILKLPAGHTVLVALNIDIAPRIHDLQRGDYVRFKGEYAWNRQGGVVHWTHRDPNGKHPDGWLEIDSKRYQ
ncbi:MAG: DUF3465 domain-containing protein [Arenimonas sp.]|nr:DUF3465 domain-containing protein [Arenimonas sp.]